MAFAGNGNTVRFTVVIPVYNREKYVKEAIESVLPQASGDWKLLVVDDASSDGTPEVISSYLHDRRIEYVRLVQNEGLSRALNRGLELVDTPFFLQLDSDDWLEEGALEQLQKHAAEQPENIAMIYGNFWVWKKRKGRWRKKLVKPPLIGHACECTISQVPRPRLYRTSVLRAVGGWSTDDPFNGRFMEDRRMMIKLKDAGYSFHYIDRVLYNLRLHRGSKSLQKSNRHAYRQVKAWLYPQLVERWGEDQFRMETRGKLHIVRVDKAAGSKSDCFPGDLEASRDRERHKTMATDNAVQNERKTVAVVGEALGQTLVHLEKIPYYRVIVVRKSRVYREEGVEVFPFPPGKDWTGFIKDRNVRLLHAYSGTVAARVSKLSRRFGVPMVVLFRGADLTVKTRDPDYRRRLQEVVFKQSRLLIAVCEYLRERLIDLGSTPEKTFLWRRGIDLELFPYRPPGPPGKDEPVRIISVGRLTGKKGMNDLIIAFARFLKEHPAGHLTIVGEGTLRPEIDKLVSDLNLENKVKITGSVHYRWIPEYLRRSHIFAIASRTADDGDQEGIPRALLEAMATGLPVLATRHAGIPEVVSHGKNGLLVDERDVDGFCSGLTHLASRPAEWRQMGEQSRQWIEEKGELNCQMRALGALYDLALGKTDRS